MTATVLFLALLVVVLAALGRASTPPAERLPWFDWIVRDLFADVVAGLRAVSAGSSRRQALWEAMLDDLQPWQRRQVERDADPDDGGRAGPPQ